MKEVYIPPIRKGNLSMALELGLFEEEYELIVKKIGRTPTATEIAMFSGMWSEHCSYKNSILLLKTLYSESDRMMAAAGEENAGALKLNDEYAVVFKVESHNHPSALEPYQGAATGVGGIMRDVFTMGARPILSLNSLRFGDLDEKKNRWLFREVVKGIGDYGNSLGIATGGGEVFFHPSYTKNPLVNAMTIGIVKNGKIASSRASGPGNIVMYVGAKTGKDGIHGASFASKELSDESAEERSAVQVGDPFMEKQLMEATLECIDKELVVAIQDMGAAGLISSSSEMASSGGVGMNLHLEKIPAREENMEPFEFLLSESQERMLLVAKPEKTEEITRVFKKWELDAVRIGEITDTGNLKIYYHGELYADLPARYLTVNKDGAPRYSRETRKSVNITDDFEDYRKNKISLFKGAIKSQNTEKIIQFIEQMITHPNLASKNFIYEQYDTDIGIHRYTGPGYNAGLHRIFNSGMSIASSIDGNGYYVKVNPYHGTMHTVAEGYRNIISTGASPLGITNCLNYANPYKPENYYYFERSIQGMSDAAQYFQTPVTGGNVSFYNESEDGPVLPTPAIGTVGLLEDNEKRSDIKIEQETDIYLAGFFEPGLSASQFAYIMDLIPEKIQLPPINLESEKKTGDLIKKIIQLGWVDSVMDMSSGGLFTSLLRMLFHEMNSSLGFEMGEEWKNYIEQKDMNEDMFFWGESAHSYLIAIRNNYKEDVHHEFENHKIPLLRLGKTNLSKTLKFSVENFNLSISLENIRNKWLTAIENYMG